MPHYEFFCQDCKRLFSKILSLVDYEKGQVALPGTTNIFWRSAMKRINLVVLILSVCLVSVSWGQQPTCQFSPFWAEFHKQNMQRWNQLVISPIEGQ
jgi:hypothetical protein